MTVLNKIPQVEKIKLMVAIPSISYVNIQFVQCLMRFIQYLDSKKMDYSVEIISDTLVYIARDKLAKRAIDGGFTHVLWLDADMVFKETIFENLKRNNKDIITGIYHGRRPPFRSVIFKSVWKNIDRWDGSEYPSEVFEIGGCGFGCVLVKTEILKTMMQKFSTCFFPFPTLGEDLAFCKRASDLEYKIYADPSIKLGHIGNIPIYPGFKG